MAGLLVHGMLCLIICSKSMCVYGMLFEYSFVYYSNNNRCVKDVTDIHFLFVDKIDFNEDINSWDTSSGKYRVHSYVSCEVPVI